MNSSPSKSNDPTSVSPGSSELAWQLEGCFSVGERIRQVPLINFPTSVGRTDASDLQVASQNVSSRHAEILVSEGVVLVRDVGSTNGTYINGSRITQPTPVGAGDLIQFADMEFRLLSKQQEAPVAEQTFVGEFSGGVGLLSKLSDLLNTPRVDMMFQVVRDLHTEEILGAEALVRSPIEGLRHPGEIFPAAEQLGLEGKLSRLCRSEAVRIAAESGRSFRLFLNTHPVEALEIELLRELEVLNRSAPNLTLVLEVHEGAVSDVAKMRDFRNGLHALGMQLAYDDFGAGQSRLLELSDAPPDVLKFDRSLLHGLHTAPSAHQKLVQSLLTIARETGATPLAEGIEDPQDAVVCRQMGFELVQGYLFGRPAPFMTAFAS